MLELRDAPFKLMLLPPSMLDSVTSSLTLSIPHQWLWQEVASSEQD